MHFRYSKNLVDAKNFGIRKGMIVGGGMGLLFLVIFGSYALGFWYGGKLVREEDYTAGRMLIVSICYFRKSHLSLPRMTSHIFLTDDMLSAEC